MNLKNASLSALVAALLVAGSAHAAVGATSGQIIIRGTVGSICEIGVVDYGTNLNLTAGETNRPVGQVTETCNDPDGYSVSFASEEGGKMVGPLDAESAYRINYDTLSSHSLASDAVIDRPDPKWNKKHDLTVNVQGQTELPAGEYRDTVTVTIAAA
jgi:spore coat protein U-like protein